jgi:hypothetical protein
MKGKVTCKKCGSVNVLLEPDGDVKFCGRCYLMGRYKAIYKIPGFAWLEERWGLLLLPVFLFIILSQPFYYYEYEYVLGLAFSVRIPEHGETIVTLLLQVIPTALFLLFCAKRLQGYIYIITSVFSVGGIIILYVVQNRLNNFFPFFTFNRSIGFYASMVLYVVIFCISIALFIHMQIYNRAKNIKR